MGIDNQVCHPAAHSVHEKDTNSDCLANHIAWLRIYNQSESKKPVSNTHQSMSGLELTTAKTEQKLISMYT